MTGEISQYTAFYELDSSFVPSETSLNWNIANITTGIDFDFLISRNFAISFGANYTSKENYNAWGGNFGIGLFSYTKGVALRFDAGLKIQTMNYDAYTVSHIRYSDIFGNEEEYVAFYHDIGESTHFDPYFNLTFNTAYKDWPVNFFINGGYVIQTLFSFEPSTSYFFFGTYTQSDKRGSSTSGFINLTPGIYFNFGTSSRVLMGSRIYIETQIGEADPNYFIMPMVQVDFTL
jgi:hypothetical protein